MAGFDQHCQFCGAPYIYRTMHGKSGTIGFNCGTKIEIRRGEPIYCRSFECYVSEKKKND